MIRKLASKDLTNFQFFCSQRDIYSDFYIIKNENRLFLNKIEVAKTVFGNILRRGDKGFIKEEGNTIKGVLFVTGYADKFHKKFVRILANDKKTIKELINFLLWENGTDLYIKVRTDNPIVQIAKESGFIQVQIFNNRVLLYRKYDKDFDYSKKPKYVKQEDMAE